MIKVLSPSQVLTMLVMAAFLFCIPASSIAAPAKADDPLKSVKIAASFAYLGGFSFDPKHPERRGAAKGIEVVEISPDGKWTSIQTVETFSPGFLAMDSQKRFLYSSQGDGFEVGAYAIDATTGKLTLLNKKESSGRNGTHLAVSPDDRFVVVANYADGTVDSFAINQDGSLGERVSSPSTQGDLGPLKAQSKSMPHHAGFSKDGRFVLISDKGRDTVHVFTFDKATGKLAPHTPAGMTSRRNGLGTRRFDWHPTQPFAYILEESADSITVASWDEKKGVLKPIQWVPSVSDTTFHEGDINPILRNGSSELYVAKSGKFLYATNRSDTSLNGIGSIGCWAIDQKTGRLTPNGWFSIGAELPRHFNFDPSYKVIFVANQWSGTITALTINEQTGELSLVGTVYNTGSPSCILFK